MKFSKAQQGVGLPAAIFVITVMVIIALAINAIVEQNAQTFEEEVNLTRAFYAAESAAGFAMNGIYPPEEYPGYAGSACPTTTYSFTVPGLNECSAEVTCDTKTVDSRDYITIDSEGTCGDVTRIIQVRTSN